MSELQGTASGVARGAARAHADGARAGSAAAGRVPGSLLVLAFLIVFPLLFSQSSGFLQATIIALAYVVMALGLNVVIGFAGLLDLGYVAFYAFGAYAVGWFGSDFFFAAHVNVLSSATPGAIGIHLNFILVLICAVIVTSIAGMIIGLPTLRLRGDYIAIVTLAFGEIIGTLVVNGSTYPPWQRHDGDRRQPRDLRAGPAVLPGDRDVRPAQPETVVLVDIGDRVVRPVRRLPPA